MPLCTVCNRQIKPVVAIDIDGTMGDYHGHFLKFAEAYLGQRIARQYDGDVSFREWFKDQAIASDEDWHDIKLAYRQGGMKRSMPMFPKASELCHKIAREEAELWVTTTRPYIRHDNIDPDTRFWLERNDIVYDYLIYDGDKYKKLAELVGADRVCAVVDDLGEEITEAARLFGPDVPILRRNRFNNAVAYHTEAFDLGQITNLVLDRIWKWNENHAGERTRENDTVRVPDGT